MAGAIALLLICGLAPRAAAQAIHQGPIFHAIGAGSGSFDVAVHPDGPYLLSAGAQGAHLLRSDTGERVRTIHYGRDISSVAFSRSGERILTGSWDHTARVWDPTTGNEILRIVGHSDRVQDVAFSPDDSLILTASWDGTAALWDSTTGAPVTMFEGHAERVYTADFSPDGQRIVTGSFDGTIRIWNLDEPATPIVIQQGSQIWGVAWSPTGELIGSAALDSSVQLWDAITGEQVRSLEGATEGQQKCLFSHDGQLFFSGGSDNMARAWRVADGVLATTFTGHAGYVEGLSLAPDETLITGSVDTTLRRWNVATGDEIQQLKVHTKQLNAVAFSPDGRFLFGGQVDGTAEQWEFATGQSVRTYQGHAQYLFDIKISPDGTQLATASLDQTVKLWDTATGALQHTLTGFTGAVTKVAYHPSGDQLAAVSAEFLLNCRVFNPRTGTRLADLIATFFNSTLSCVYAPTGSSLVTGASNGEIGIFETPSGMNHVIFSGGPINVPARSLAFSRDGNHVGVGAGKPQPGSEIEDREGENAVFLLDPHTLSTRHQFDGHTDEVLNVRFSPDSKLLVSASIDGTARVWSVDERRHLATLTDHTIVVTDAEFSPDGKLLATSSWDGTILLHELSPPRAIVVAGGGPYAGNSIARQTHELGVYTYRTLLARGYAPEDVLYLSAFPEGTAFPGGSVVAWDIDGDGVPDVDGLATREALEGALAGDFARDAGRLLVLMMDHGYRTGDTVAFRLNPTEAVTTVQMNAMLDELQNAAAVDVTLVVDCCYSGQFAVDCAKTDAIPSARERIVIASTSPTTEAVFLPAPDLTSFMYTFLSSAYMGNSMGEAFRSGARFFRYFPVAGQSPRIHDGERLYTDDELFDSPANKRFFGATWAYGVQADKNINQFFPAFASVEPAGTVAPGEPVTLRATMLPFQSPERVTVAILPPAPTVLSGEPIVGLPRAELVRIGDDRAAGEVWEITLAPGDPAFPFREEGAYRATFTAQFGFNRNSDPERTAFTITSGPDPDATSIRAVLAFGTSIHAPTAESLDGAAKYAYAVYLDRYQDPNGDRRADWIDVYTNAPLKYAKDTTRRIEQRAAEALVYTKTGAPTTSAILASIATRGAEAGRLVVHLAGDDASDATLRFGNGQTLTAAQLDAALDAITSDEIIVIIDAPGSGTFLAPLAATGAQQRVVLTSGRAGDCAIFLADPAITYTHKLLGPLWSGVSFDAAHRSADGFFRSFVGEFSGTRIAPQLDDNRDGVYTFADGQLAARLYMGRRYAFAGDEASGLPFIIESEVIPPGAPGLAATLRVRLLEGIEPATDAMPDPLDAARVYAQFTPPGVLCGEGATTLPRFRLRREGANAWSWSAPIAPAFLEGLGTGQHPVMFYAEYPDGSTTKMSEPVVESLNIQLTPDTPPAVWLVR